MKKQYFCIIHGEYFEPKKDEIFWCVGGDSEIAICGECYPDCTKADILNALEKCNV